MHGLRLNTSAAKGRIAIISDIFGLLRPDFIQYIESTDPTTFVVKDVRVRFAFMHVKVFQQIIRQIKDFTYLLF